MPIKLDINMTLNLWLLYLLLVLKTKNTFIIFIILIKHMKLLF